MYFEGPPVYSFYLCRWREQQASLMKIYERQKERGGIIDLEEERKKNLVTEDTVSICHFSHFYRLIRYPEGVALRSCHKVATLNRSQNITDITAACVSGGIRSSGKLYFKHFGGQGVRQCLPSVFHFCQKLFSPFFRRL